MHCLSVSLKLKGWEQTNQQRIKTMNFYEKENFDQAVYIIEDNEIEQITLRELCLEFADETTTPNGINKRFHLREGVELWTWGVNGKNPAMVEAFDSEEEADHALMLCHRFDLLNGDDNPIVYNTKAEAIAEIA